MASFERYSSPSRGGSMSETRFESWAVAHNKNCGEQKLLKNRLKELDRERARSLYVLSMDLRCVKKDHNKLLMDRRLVVNSPHFGESSNPRLNGVHPAMSGRSDNDRMQERVDSWKIEMAQRCQSASPRMLTTTTTTKDTIDQAAPNQLITSLGIPLPKRPASSPMSGNMESITTDCLGKGERHTKLCDVAEDPVTTSTQKRGPNLESMPLRLRARRADIDRMVQSKVSRLKTLSRVPADFNLRAKTSSVSRSGQPQISLNCFHEHHQKGKAHGKATESPAQSRRKTNQNAR